MSISKREKAYKSYAHDLVSVVLESIGRDPRDNETKEIKALRQNVIYFLKDADRGFIVSDLMTNAINYAKLDDYDKMFYQLMFGKCEGSTFGKVFQVIN